MTTTSNHGWDIPTVGGDEDVWGEILNDFFNDELDRQVTLEGPFSERPDAATGNVKYYHATDRRIVYYNDGSSWEAVYGLGTDSNSVPGTSHFEAVTTEVTNTTDEYQYRDNPLIGWHEVEQIEDDDANSNFDIMMSGFGEGEFLFRLELERTDDFSDNMDALVDLGNREETRQFGLSNNSDGSFSTFSMEEESVLIEFGTDGSYPFANLWLSLEVKEDSSNFLTVLSGFVQRQYEDGLEKLSEVEYRRLSLDDVLRISGEPGLEATATLKRFEKQ